MRSGPPGESGGLSVLLGTGSLYDTHSGPYLAVKELAAALGSQGCSVSVVGTKDRISLPAPQSWSNVAVYPFAKLGPYSLHFPPNLASWLRGKAPMFDVANLHGVWLMSNATIARWCTRQRIPYMVTVHGSLNSLALRYSRGKKWLAKSLFVGRFLREARCLHALNDAEFNAIREFGLTQPVFVIPNGIRVPTHGDLNRGEVGQSTPEGKRVLLYLGRLHRIKNIERLILAWRSLRSQHANWHLFIGGDSTDDYRARLEAFVRNCGLAESVTFLGYLEGAVKSRWLQAAAAFVLPSVSEGFAMAPLEAMAYGRPVLLTEECNFPEVALASAGLIVRSSEDGLRAGLGQMLALPSDALRAMGERGRALARASYDWEVIGKQVKEAYLWMLGGDAPPTLRLS